MSNVQQIIRLILLNAYKTDLPELTADIQDLRQSCPALFNKTLSRADKRRLQTDLLNMGDEDQELDIEDSADNNHKQPTMIGRINVANINNIEHAIVQWNRPKEEIPSGFGNSSRDVATLPLSASAMTEQFKR